jgi:23S rRNA (pseudouridine1915-N3)-methyltransferase
LVELYRERSARTLKTELLEFKTERGFWEWVDRQRALRETHLILADSKGVQRTSVCFAAYLAELRSRSLPACVLGIGPADGWSGGSLGRADLLLSLGPMTLPHELAAVVLAEQVYRATTIWTGHPYHGGH